MGKIDGRVTAVLLLQCGISSDLVGEPFQRADFVVCPAWAFTVV